MIHYDYLFKDCKILKVLEFLDEKLSFLKETVDYMQKHDIGLNS